MAKLQDLPVMITEFRDLAKEYLLQETVGQAKKLGHFAGFSLGAAALWALAIMLLGVAGLRGLVKILPEGAYWEALAYLIVVIIALVIVAILVNLGPKSEPEPAQPINGGTS
jgi:asparagine N-glycosylation enzyme membrane subunit Stt3